MWTQYKRWHQQNWNTISSAATNELNSRDEDEKKSHIYMIVWDGDGNGTERNKLNRNNPIEYCPCTTAHLIAIVDS